MQYATARTQTQGGWFVNYDASIAVHNYCFLLNQSPEHATAPRIWRSRDCAAIVVSTIPLSDIAEPHVMAWRDSFFTISLRRLIGETAIPVLPETQ